MTGGTTRPRSSRLLDSGEGGDLWLRRLCAVVVASVAAYASYMHQRAFALQGGADGVSATLWPLSVDGLLLLATVGLLKTGEGASARARVVVWLAFLLGIAVSLAANIAAAPALAWRPFLVAGWPPVALLLSVELLAHRPAARVRREAGQRESPVGQSRPRETTERQARDERADEAPVTVGETGGADAGQRGSAEQVMWQHFQMEQARGRTPTGAELDRVAGTNYGRAALARWRRAGRIPETSDRVPSTRPPGDVAPKQPDPHTGAMIDSPAPTTSA